LRKREETGRGDLRRAEEEGKMGKRRFHTGGWGTRNSSFPGEPMNNYRKKSERNDPLSILTPPLREKRGKIP